MSHVVSPLAAKLWETINQRGGNWLLEELQRDLKTSKARLNNALVELEEAGLIRLEEA